MGGGWCHSWTISCKPSEPGGVLYQTAGLRRWVQGCGISIIPGHKTFLNARDRNPGAKRPFRSSAVVTRNEPAAKGGTPLTVGVDGGSGGATLGGGVRGAGASVSRVACEGGEEAPGRGQNDVVYEKQR